MATSTVTDAEALADAVAKSGLLSAESLAKVREAAAKSSDAKSLARDLVKNGTLTLWQARQLIHGYFVLVVGKYKLLEELGSGETGRVYLAEHAQINRRHALKILSRRQTAKPDVLKRFLSEAQRLCALDHRNLSHVYDVNQDGDKYFLVMDYVEGQDLRKLVEVGGPLPTAKAVELAQQAIDGLMHAHEKQVIHGDLKPTNLIVDASGTLKITDVGQGRLVEAPAAKTSEGSDESAALASAAYRAPELRTGGGTADVRSDVYSLGNVLCFLLAGRPAADAADAKTVLSGVRSVPSVLANLCCRMLADDPGQRPQSMLAVLGQLRTISVAPAAGGETPKPASLPLPKAKKPPVAKAIETMDEEAVVVAAAPDNGSPADTGNPLAGLAVNAQPRSRSPRTSASAASSSSELVATAPNGPKSRRTGPKKNSLLPVVMVIVLGGGLLLLAGVGYVVIGGLNWSGGEAKKTVAAAKSTTAKVDAQAEAAAAEAIVKAALDETNPAPPAEVNLAPVAEANPDPAAAAATTPAAVPTAPPPPSEAPKPAEPTPASPMPVPNPTPANPAPPPLVETATAALPRTEPAQPAPATAADPFKGLRGAINLPKLTPGVTEPPPEALAPLVIGPCAPDATAQLKGGDGAIRARTKFELVEGKDEQSLGKWNVMLVAAGMPLKIAQFSVQNKQLTFLWTPEGAAHESSPYLGNCKLVLSAGTELHEVALREPMKGESLLVDLEKMKAEVKWTIDYLPDAKKIVVAVSRLADAFPTHKFEDSPTLEGAAASTLIWTGKDEESMFLGIKLISSVAAKNVKIESIAQRRVGNGTKPLLKKDLAAMANEIDQQRLGLNRTEQALARAKGKEADAAKKSLKASQDDVNARGEEFNKLQQLILDLKDKSEIHFRVYYQADDTQVDLLVTDDDAPKAKQTDDAKKPDDTKKKK